MGRVLAEPANPTTLLLAWGRGDQVRWQNRSHFFAMASRVMRRILVDWLAKVWLLRELSWVEAR
jgi:hypothetical protein